MKLLNFFIALVIAVTFFDVTLGARKIVGLRRSGLRFGKLPLFLRSRISSSAADRQEPTVKDTPASEKQTNRKLNKPSRRISLRPKPVVEEIDFHNTTSRSVLNRRRTGVRRVNPQKANSLNASSSKVHLPRFGLRPPFVQNNRNKLTDSTNREERNFLNPLARDNGGFQFGSRNIACETKKGKGYCVYMWECPSVGAIRENVAPCSSYFFQQCCTFTMNVISSTTMEAPTTDAEIIGTSTVKKNESFTDSEIFRGGIQIDSPADEDMLIPVPGKVKPPPLLGFPITPNVRTSTEKPHGWFEKSNLNPKVYDCGFRPLVVESRILGGKTSGFGSWPWIASVRKIGRRQDRNGDLHRSGGSLISDQWVLTAAHTVARTARIVVSEAELLVRLGDYNLKVEDELLPHVNRKVSKIFIHPGFNGITYENDIALLKLEKKIQFEGNIQPVCLPEPEYADRVQERLRQKEWRTGTIAGWGRTAQGGDQSDVVLDVELPIVTNTECEAMFAKQNYSEDIPNQFICAGGEEIGGRDSCQGDSGGPMVVNLGPNRWQLVGIVSWGIGCGMPGLPGVLTSVSHYTDWIVSTIDESSI